MKDHRILVEVGGINIAYLKYSKKNYFFLIKGSKVMSGLNPDFNQLVKEACVKQGFIKYY